MYVTTRVKTCRFFCINYGMSILMANKSTIPMVVNNNGKSSHQNKSIIIFFLAGGGGEDFYCK